EDGDGDEAARRQKNRGRSCRRSALSYGGEPIEKIRHDTARYSVGLHRRRCGGQGGGIAERAGGRRLGYGAGLLSSAGCRIARVGCVARPRGYLCFDLLSFPSRSLEQGTGDGASFHQGSRRSDQTIL